MSQRVTGVRRERRETESILRALASVYQRGFKHGYDAAFFAASACDSPFPISDLARVNDESEDATRARIERGAEAFVAFAEGRPQVMDVELVAQSMAGLQYETVDLARAALEKSIAEHRAQHPEPRVVAPVLADGSSAEPERSHCLQCGRSLPPPPETGGRPRRYCSARCRASHFRGGL